MKYGFLRIPTVDFLRKQTVSVDVQKAKDEPSQR